LTEQFPETAFLDLIARLAAADGPSLAEGPRGEALAAYLTAAGLAVRTDAAGNLWTRLGPEAWTEAVVFDAHLDVVERGRPERLIHEGRRLQGLGVGDNLTSVALLALAMCAFHEASAQPVRPIEALFSVGEEGLGDLRGVRQAARDRPEPPWAFVSLDGPLGTYYLAGLGRRRYRVEVRCAGGHAWQDYGAPSAVHELVQVLADLKAAHAGLAAGAETTLSFNIGAVQGGKAVNSIARDAEALFEYGSESAALLDKAHESMRAILDRAGARAGVELAWTQVGDRPAVGPVRPERVEPVVRAALEAEGVAPRCAVASTNSNATLAAGWPSVTVGVRGGGNPHREDEWIELDELPAAWRVLGTLIDALAFRGRESAGME